MSQWGRFRSTHEFEPKRTVPTDSMMAKYNPDAMEWSLMELEVIGEDTVLRFAGAGRWKYGNPEGLDRLKPGGTFIFGETRLQIVRGNWKQAYYAYRRYMEGKGCVPHEGYNAPVHWNELYDNEYFFKSCAISDKPNVSVYQAGFLRLPVRA